MKALLAVIFAMTRESFLSDSLSKWADLLISPVNWPNFPAKSACEGKYEHRSSDDNQQHIANPFEQPSKNKCRCALRRLRDIRARVRETTVQQRWRRGISIWYFPCRRCLSNRAALSDLRSLTWQTQGTDQESWLGLSQSLSSLHFIDALVSQWWIRETSSRYARISITSVILILTWCVRLHFQCWSFWATVEKSVRNGTGAVIYLLKIDLWTDPVGCWPCYRGWGEHMDDDGSLTFAVEFAVNVVWLRVYEDSGVDIVVVVYVVNNVNFFLRFC